MRQFGPYRLEELIARGGMGEVHRAYDSRHDRFVALKLLGEDVAGDDEFRERFRREAHAAARLREPHVIPIHAYGEIDGRLYLDMRLVEGKNLRTTLVERGAMDPAEAVRVIEQVASALDAAHAEGLVHRDIKPSNVIIDASGFVYLIDFGIARSVSANTDITTTGNTVGTLAYMAPERFGSAPVDHRVDVYALTCVLFQCLTGVLPFSAENALAVIFAHVNHDPPRPTAFRAGLAAEFDQVIARGMAKDPQQRFASAGELALAARRALTTTPSIPLTAPASRRRWPIGVGILIVVAAVVTGLFWLLPKQSAQQGQPTATSTSNSSRPAADLGLPTQISSPACDGSYIVVVGSAVAPDHYATDIQRFLANNPNSKYLHTPSAGCGSLRTHVDGAEIYSVYYGPFPDKKSACERRTALGGDAFVRRLDNTTAPYPGPGCG